MAPPVSSTGSAWSNPVDNGGRSWLRLDDPGARSAVATATDVGVLTLAIAPPAFTLTRLGIRRDWGQFGRTALIYGLAEGLNLGGAYVVKTAAHRARPCKDDSDAKSCGNEDPNASFYSGHTSTAMLGATLHCGDALAYNLYGSKGANIAACAAGYGVATAVGVGRIAGDKHWTTDVLVGGATGIGLGLLVPLVVGRGEPSLKLGDGVAAVPTISAGPDGAQVGLSGTF